MGLNIHDKKLIEKISFFLWVKKAKEWVLRPPHIF